MVSDGLYPFESRYHELEPGIRQHYLDEGPAKGRPVVMLHGNPSWSFLYRDLVRAVSGSHRAIVPDHVGCGLSDKPGLVRYPYTLERRVADLESLLDGLGVTDDISLVMHDWGGMIGMAWAARHPERVARLVVLNTAGFHLPASKRLPRALAICRDTAIGAFLVLRLNAFVRAWAWVGQKKGRMPPAVRRRYLEPHDSVANRISVLRFVQDIPLVPADPGYEIVSQAEAALERFSDTPTLICWGERDFVFDTEFLDEWVRRLPNAVVHRFPEAGHLVSEDEPEAVTRLVAEFLGSTAAS